MDTWPGIDNALGVRDTANKTFEGIDFEFRVAETPTVLHNLILERNKERNRARVVAGYCWDWASKRTSMAYDIVLEEGRYKKRWNLDQDGSLWIVAPNSVDEVGCIHTCQGLEVDYIGVIIGPDLLVRDGKVLTDYRARARMDRRKSFGGIENLMKRNPEGALARADVIIKNTYRTLMSRGMKGCYIWSHDPETQAHFKSLALE